MKKNSFDQLINIEGIQKLDDNFTHLLQTNRLSLYNQLKEYRSETLAACQVSDFLIQLAQEVEFFLADFFQIKNELNELNEKFVPHNRVAKFKKIFVMKARHYRKPIEPSFAELDQWLDSVIGLSSDKELAVAEYALTYEKQPEAFAFEKLMQWCHLALSTAQGQKLVATWSSFKLPQKKDYGHLIPLQTETVNGVQRRYSDNLRQRQDFNLTDERMTSRQAQGEINYCIYCHDHQGDFCSIGFPKKKKAADEGLKKNPLGEILTGCPLGEKISEMQWLKKQAYSLAALVMIMRDNPMVPATGHRICNDCMKACIYQKQDPVDIPQTETQVLMDVLELPWGVEIFDLLTRWNPLRVEQYRILPYNGFRVLVAGMGPAGFSMVHHLTMEGCAVIGIDGLKIEPLPESLLKQPIKHYADLKESLDERVTWGFGGVSEYGITVRWDKNFLKLIYLSLARRENFAVYGGVRLGGTITMEDVWRLGFDHLCIATGAGLPKVIPMKNSLAKGMRQASDFLMALQLTGAAKNESLANLQVRLPAVVIGGGLTAIDAATEIQPYYIKQCEKILFRYEKMIEQQGEALVFSGLGEEQKQILATFIAHGKAIRAEKARALANHDVADLLTLIHSWGGVTVVYRRSLNESPAYLRNHEEVILAMQEGIYYAEGLEPFETELDNFGHAQTLVCIQREKKEGRWLDSNQKIKLAAKTILIAAGATPNTIYEHEHPGTFELEGNHFLPHVCHVSSLQPTAVKAHCKVDDFGAFTSYHKDNCSVVSFIGDTHPVFHGSVVKAISSAARTYPEIMHALLHRPPNLENSGQHFLAQIDYQLSTFVDTVKQDYASVTEIHIQAPLAAKNYQTGQIFRLQSYETKSKLVQGTRLQIAPMTVSGIGVVDNDKIRLMVLQGGGAGSKLASQLQAGDDIVLMGPTGCAMDIPENKTVLLIAGAWGAAVILDLGKKLRESNNKVLFLAAYRHKDDLFHQQALEDSVHQILWTNAQGPLISCHRKQDQAINNSNVIEVLSDYAKQSSGISLADVDEILIMGSTGLLKAMASALKGELKACFKSNVVTNATVGSPMQCMLKGVCAQCLQWQINPDTGKRTRAVFSCAKQDQPLFWLDLDNLQDRQSQNYLAERFSAHWLNTIQESTIPELKTQGLNREVRDSGNTVIGD